VCPFLFLSLFVLFYCALLLFHQLWIHLNETVLSVLIFPLVLQKHHSRLCKKMSYIIKIHVWIHIHKLVTYLKVSCHRLDENNRKEPCLFYLPRSMPSETQYKEKTLVMAFVSGFKPCWAPCFVFGNSMFSHFLICPNISFSWDGACSNRHCLLCKEHGFD